MSNGNFLGETDKLEIPERFLNLPHVDTSKLDLGKVKIVGSKDYKEVDSMTLNEYQEQAGSTAIYPGRGTLLGLLYTGLGLGEAGEVQNKLKKLLRDDELGIDANNNKIPFHKKMEILGELGGNLWYISQCAKELGFTLQEVAQLNLNELNKRAKTGTIKGSGDDRGKDAEIKRDGYPS